MDEDRTKVFTIRSQAQAIPNRASAKLAFQSRGVEGMNAFGDKARPVTLQTKMQVMPKTYADTII